MIRHAPGHIEVDELLNELQRRKGLIPVWMDAEERILTWMDMGMYHFYEGFFRKSISVYGILKTDIVSFTTSLDVLQDNRVADDFIYPTGFIFHAGHCRSTALAKALARSRQNLVLSEATAPGQILKVFPTGKEMVTESNKRLYRNLILAMCRRRVKTHVNAFIKFTSYNIHFFDLIHSALPDVPAIFLSRNRDEIVASFRKRPPGWLKDGDNLEEKVKGFITKAESIPRDILIPVDHIAVTPENLPVILSYFNVSFDEAELNLMKSQFCYDSKVEFNQKIFGDKAT